MDSNSDVYVCTLSLGIVKNDKPFCDITIKYANMDYANVHQLESGLVGGLLAMGAPSAD